MSKLPDSLAPLAAAFQAVTGIPMDEAIDAHIEGKGDELLHRIAENARQQKDTLAEAVKELEEGLKNDLSSEQIAQALRAAPTLEADLRAGKLHSFEEVFPDEDKP